MANQRTGRNLSNDIDREGQALSRAKFMEFQRETLQAQDALLEIQEAIARVPMGPIQNRCNYRARDDDGIRIRYVHNRNHAPLNRPPAYEEDFSDDEDFAEAV